jgi:uncharacterized membrane protein YagU involved in acid resistance
MSQFHALLPKTEEPSPEKDEDSTVKAASAIAQGIFHGELTESQKKIAGPAVHYGFGAAMGALYGTAVELAQPECTGWGIPFGAAVWLGAHVITVPALGLSEPVTESAPASEGAEFASHLVYGAATEGLRTLVRARLLRG